ncbi:MAG: hypothetical protein JWM95_5359 [Gemmatimonadetes bacterium]|nr:hypothetical protein [Gemmatimonadota bacterium]
MRLTRPIAAATLAFAAILTASATGRANTAPGESAEFLRINQMHDDSVVAELSTHDVSGLSHDQKIRRASLLSELHAYGEHGAFPHNYDFPGQKVPYFVDPQTGALCAVANLLAYTGRRDVVDRVARTNNHVWVQQLAGDSTFRGWLTENGLTLDEAARIQLPAGQSGPPPVALMAGAAVVSATGLSIIAGVTISSLWNATSNADGHMGKMSKIGMTSGVAAAVVGGLIATGTPARGIGAMTLGAGLASVALSARSMQNHSAIVAAQDVKKGTLAQVTLAPVVSAEKGGSAGMSMSLKF